MSEEIIKCGDCGQFKINKTQLRNVWEGKCRSFKVGRSSETDACSNERKQRGE